MISSNTDYLSKINDANELPAIPLVLVQLNKVMNNPRCDIKQIASVIAKDQGLASKVIRLINSSFYGLPNRVNSIQTAVVMLGLDTVRNLMLGIHMCKMYSDPANKSFDYMEFWKHSLATAIIAKNIAEELDADADAAFISGLMHDFGRLLLDQFFHSEYIECLNITKERKIPLRFAEKGKFGADHTLAAEVIAKHWKLPEPIIAVVSSHHTTKSISTDYLEYEDLIRIVAKANFVAKQSGVGISPENLNSKDIDSVKLDIDFARLLEIVKESRITISSTVREWRS